MGTKKLTNELLKSKMTDAMVYRRIISVSEDLNNIKEAGIYISYTGGQSNAPNANPYFFLKVWHAASNDYIIQEHISHTGEMRMRTYWYNAWYPWRVISSTGM